MRQLDGFLCHVVSSHIDKAFVWTGAFAATTSWSYSVARTNTQKQPIIIPLPGNQRRPCIPIRLPCVCASPHLLPMSVCHTRALNCPIPHTLMYVGVRAALAGPEDERGAVDYVRRRARGPFCVPKTIYIRLNSNNPLEWIGERQT